MRIGAAMREVPRHQFVPAAWRKMAYLDTSLPIGAGRRSPLRTWLRG